MDLLRVIKIWLFNWDHVKGCREAMKLSYKKHYELAASGKIPVDTSPHRVALAGALGSRYMAYRTWGLPAPNDVLIYPNLVPFLLMDENIGIQALTEYVLYQEKPEAANLEWLREVVNRAFRSNAFKSSRGGRTFAMSGLTNNVPWCELLELDVREFLEKDAAYIEAEIENGTWDID